MTDEIKKKLKSRKFLVIMGWNVLLLTTLVTDTFFNTPGYFKDVLPWVGGMTTGWIAVQGVIDGRKT